MLIRFSVENFLSFNERTTFSMIPGKGTLKSDHISSEIGGIKTLKMGVVLGANASGKSNLLKAMVFGKHLILEGSKTRGGITFENFKLDSEAKTKPSRIEYEFQSKGKNYAYGFVFNSSEILEEWLFETNKKTEHQIFERNHSQKNIFNLGGLFKKNPKAKEQQFLEFIASATPHNQLFLTEILKRNVSENVSDIIDLKNVIHWFEETLRIIFPNDKYKEILKLEIKDNEILLSIFTSLLRYFDTGIKGISLEDITNEEMIEYKTILNRAEKDIIDTGGIDITEGLVYSDHKTFLFDKENDNIKFKKFVTQHSQKGSDEFVHFESNQESDGTNRIMDFIPLLIDLIKGESVFIIDELERSLHPNLMYDLLDLYLSMCKGINSQLILATHESTLLSQKLLRKDEIWFTVKNQFGSTEIHSLEEYNIRFDKEIMKDYLLGRFKGIPKLGDRNSLIELKNLN